MNELLSMDLLMLLLPLIVIQLGLAIYCAVLIVKEGVENLNKWAWLAISIFVNFFGPLVFLIVGRKKA